MAWMADPPKQPRDESSMMLELQVSANTRPNVDIASSSSSGGGRIILPTPSTTNTTSNGFASNGHAPVMISMTQDEYTNRRSRESVLQRLSEALLRRSLTKIDLSQRGLQPSDARLVKMALSQNAHLTSLKLGYNNLGDDGVTTLSSGIAVHKSLVSLDLGFNNFGDEGAKALAKALGDNAKRSCMVGEKDDSRSRKGAGSSGAGGTVRTLYLAGNLIGGDGALAMADFIREGSNLRKLYMTGNRIGAEGVKAITDAILEDELRRGVRGHRDEASNSPMETAMPDFDNPANFNSSKHVGFQGMQELFFGGTGMGTMGCQAVSKLLELSCSLRVISLPNCEIGDEEVAMLASGIKVNKSRLPLESIQLSFNNITHMGLESLTNAVWGSNSLRELKLDNNEVGDRGAHQVAAILPALKSLEVLDVGFNMIKAGGLNVLMKAVSENRTLQSLSVSGNAIDVPSAKAVAFALAYNTSLESLYLVHCSINHDGQRHISAGVVSNNRTNLRSLLGFAMGPVVVTLGFPDALRHWTNEQVLNFIHMMWGEKSPEGEDPQQQPNLESEMDPLNFLPNLDKASSAHRSHHAPVEASVVVEVAKKAYESLVANGVDVFTKRTGRYEPSFGSPLADESIMIESYDKQPLPPTYESNEDGGGPSPTGQQTSHTDNGWEEQMPKKQTKSFVAPPETSNATNKQEMPDPARKKRIVEWLCSNIQHLNELSQLPFSSRELWRLHQHYFTPVVNESGGAVPFSSSGPGSLIVSSVPEVYRFNPGGSAVTPSTQSSEDQLVSIPVSDPAFPGTPPGAPASLPTMLKRKVSYRSLGDAMVNSHTRMTARMENTLHNGSSVAKMIEDGHTGHSLPPKTKKARRNRTRISFVPRIKAKLDSYLDVCHEKALITMRKLYFVEQALLSGQVNPLEPSLSPRTHLAGTLASEAEMIVMDMI